MKTAVSIPDEIFEEAERLAERLRTSRSRLYSQALREYVRRHAPDHVTDSLNRVVDEVGPEENEFRRTAARRVVRKVEW
jgi:metal-responsive CopG/Arc/MetJ family transcriptional regulator